MSSYRRKSIHQIAGGNQKNIDRLAFCYHDSELTSQMEIITKREQGLGSEWVASLGICLGKLEVNCSLSMIILRCWHWISNQLKKASKNVTIRV